MNLEARGWNALLAGHWNAGDRAGLVPCRVTWAAGERLHVEGAAGELLAAVSGRLRHEVLSADELPAVGDWVAVDVAAAAGGTAPVTEVLPRRNALVRRAAGGRGTPQVLAANVDAVLVMTSLNRDLNPRRLERYLVLAWESGADPVIVLSKADLVEETASALEAVRPVVGGAPVVVVSGLTGEGVADLAPWIGPGRTVVLVGSSGVGKSTLGNRLLGRDAMEVRAIRNDDDRGRHTTTGRELFPLPAGGCLIDTPGLREVGIVASEAGLAGAFEDVASLVDQCRFRDCSHEAEPDCAVSAAVEAGTLDAGRVKRYRVLLREAARAEGRTDMRDRLAAVRKVRVLHRTYEEAKERRRRLRGE